MKVAAAELSVAMPANATEVPLGTVSAEAGAVMAAVTTSGSTVTAREAEAVPPEASVTVRTTVWETWAWPGLAKVWLAVAPAALPPSPKAQA